MKAIKATWRDGRIVPSEPVDWPEGSELVVEPAPGGAEKIGLDESEWRDDPEAVAEFEAWVHTIEPLLLSDEERALRIKFAEEMGRYNLEAVRRQMASGDPS